jgi:hypothetical protein
MATDKLWSNKCSPSSSAGPPTRLVHKGDEEGEGGVMAEMDDVLVELRHRIMGQLKPRLGPSIKKLAGKDPRRPNRSTSSSGMGLLPSRCAALLTLSEMAVLSWRSRYPSRSTLSGVAVLSWGAIQYPH